MGPLETKIDPLEVSIGAVELWRGSPGALETGMGPMEAVLVHWKTECALGDRNWPPGSLYQGRGYGAGPLETRIGPPGGPYWSHWKSRVGPLETKMGPLDVSIWGRGGGVGPLETGMGPWESIPIGPLEDRVGPLETKMGPLEVSAGTVEVV